MLYFAICFHLDFGIRIYAVPCLYPHSKCAVNARGICLWHFGHSFVAWTVGIGSVLFMDAEIIGGVVVLSVRITQFSNSAATFLTSATSACMFAVELSTSLLNILTTSTACPSAFCRT